MPASCYMLAKDCAAATRTSGHFRGYHGWDGWLSFSFKSIHKTAVGTSSHGTISHDD